MSTATQTIGHTTTKNLTPGMRVLLVAKGEAVGGGEVIAVNGRVITIAQVIDHAISSDGGPTEVVSTELALADHLISRSTVAWEL